MDQAIKSALNKYNGKKSTPSASDHSSGNLIIVVSVAILIAISFSICVKTGAFNADVLWNKITSASFDLSSIKETIQNIFIKETEQTSTLPINETGESGKVSASETVSRTLSAQYLNKISSKFQYVQPVNGTVTCNYGNRIHPISGESGFHSGIDIAASVGTTVVSFQDGIVKETGYNQTYGNYILIKHTGNESFYGHLSEIKVVNDQKVCMGQPIALVGSTGKSTGPHLHFEIRINGKTCDPSKSVYA